MTVQARWIPVAALLGMASPAWGVQSGTDASGRVFGQLKPGQTVVEINQSDELLDDGWSPVAEALPPQSLPTYPERTAPKASTEQEPVPESIAASAGATPTPEPDDGTLGGLNILETLARREAEADAASARTAARLAAEREQAAKLDAIAGTPTGSPSDLLLTGLPPQERQSLGPAPTQNTSKTNSADSDLVATAPSTNLAGDWFRAQSSTVQTLLSLGVVILLIYSLAWVYRKTTLNRGGVAGVNSGKAPSGLLEVLGRYPLGGKQSLVLLKFDRRVLLLCQGPSGKGGIEMKTLCELDQPEDVASVLMKVRDADGESLNKAFRSAMSKAELGASNSERMIEPKAAPVRPVRPSKPARSTPVEPRADVLPGHRDPFNGFGGDFVRPTRQVNANPEGDRSELWGTPPSSGASAHDPVASLKQRLEAMRRGERVK